MWVSKRLSSNPRMRSKVWASCDRAKACWCNQTSSPREETRAHTPQGPFSHLLGKPFPGPQSAHLSNGATGLMICQLQHWQELQRGRPEFKFRQGHEAALWPVTFCLWAFTSSKYIKLPHHKAANSTPWAADLDDIIMMACTVGSKINTLKKQF
jgi:hypothetical protein